MSDPFPDDYDEEKLYCECCNNEITDAWAGVNHCPNCYRMTCDNCYEGLDDLLYGWCDFCMGRC